MIDPTLDGYAIGILELHNARRRALEVIQNHALSALGDLGYLAPGAHLDVLAKVASILAIEPIQPLACVELARLATLARDADA